MQDLGIEQDLGEDAFPALVSRHHLPATSKLCRRRAGASYG